MLAATPVDYSTVTPTFRCDNPVAPGICYGIGGQSDALFRAIQTLANFFAPVAGFAPISVDGKIGANTVAALQAAARQMLQVPTTSPFGNNLLAFTTSYQTVAQNAVAVYTTLQGGIGALGLKSVPAPIATQVVPATTVTPPVTLPPLGKGPSWKPWAIGAGVLAAAGLAAYWIYTSEG